MRTFLLGAVLFAMSAGGIWAADSRDTDVTILVRSTASWDGSSLPGYPSGTPEVSVFKILIPAGAELPVHQHPIINSGVLLRGELTVTTKEDKKLHLREGDALVEVVNTWHSGKNEGSSPAEIIVFYAGVQGQPITVSGK